MNWAALGNFGLGLLGIGGTAGAGALAYKGQKETNAANAAQAQKQMDFQERMSNTSFQRQMKDLEAANLNPLLVGNLGGASTPGGAMAQMGNATEAGMSSAYRHRQNRQEVMNLKSQRGQIAAATDAANAQAEVGRANAVTTRELLPFQIRDLSARIESQLSSAEAARASARLSDSNSLLNSLSVPGARNQARMQETLFGAALPFLGAGLSTATNALPLFRGARLGNLLRRP